MPLHDVKCLNCGHVQEIFYLPGDKPDEIRCNSCNSKNTKYVMSAPVINFGGDIWERQVEQEAADNNW